MSDATAEDDIAGTAQHYQTSDSGPTAGSPARNEAVLEDYILSTGPEFVDALREADDDLKAGATRSLADVLKELGAADSGSGMTASRFV